MPSRAFWRTDNKAPTTLYAELVRRGLPTGYARRTADELEDHRADLIADARSWDPTEAQAIAEERLGETRALASTIAAEYRRRSWFGRWPLVSFVLLPIPSLVLSWVLAYLPLAGFAIVADSLGWMREYRPSVALQALIGEGALFGVLVAVPALVAFAWSRIAARCALPWPYAASACLILALFVGSGFYGELRPNAVPGEGQLLVSCPAFIGHADGDLQFLQHPKQLLQYGAPVAAAGLAFLLNRRRLRAALLAAGVAPVDGEAGVAA